MLALLLAWHEIVSIVNGIDVKNERSENMRIQCHIGNTGKDTRRGALLPTVQPHYCLSCVLCGVNSMCVVHLRQDGTRQNHLRLSRRINHWRSR